MKKEMTIKNKINSSSDAFLCGLFLAITIGVFGPLVLYLANINEFWFSIRDIWWITAIGGITLLILAYSISFLLRGKIRDFYVCFIFGLAMSFYLQGNFFNIDYGVLDGEKINWGQYTNVSIINTILWLLCLAAPFILYVLLPKRFGQIIKSVSVFIVLIQVITLGTLFLTTDLSRDETETYLTDEGKFQLSNKNNTVVFVLDAFDSSTFRELLEQQPDYAIKFKDFTYYPDTVGGGTRTNIAMPIILTGKAWTDKVSFNDYLYSAYSKSKLYDVLKKNHFDVKIYTSSSFVPSSQIGIVDNLSRGSGTVTSYSQLTKYLYKLTAFSYMPHLLKRHFWFYSGDFNNLQGGESADVYKINDEKFYNSLLSERIEVQDKEGAFRLYHLNGAHPPYSINEYAQEVSSDKTSMIKQAKGALYIVEEYINQLKKSGIYDKTTIIIIADHGSVNLERNPLFLIKEYGADKEFIIKNTPISFFDLNPTILYFVSGNETEEGSIYSFKEGEKRSRLFYRNSSKGNDIRIVEYKVEGLAWDKDAISETGNIYSGNAGSFSNKYKLGTKLSFGSTGTATEYLEKGFSYGEAGHTWTNDTNAEIKMVLDSMPKSDLVVEMEVIPTSTTGSQRMVISVGDTIVHNWSYSKSSIVKFSIPHELIKENTLSINFEFPDAVSPKEVLGKGHDPRKLAFAFVWLTIYEGVLENEAKIESYKIANTIYFTEENDGSKYFQYGIGKIEKSYAWSNGKISRFVMEVEDTNNDLECIIDLNAVSGSNQHVIITSNGQKLYDEIITSKNKKLVFIVPSSCIVNGILTLDFEYPDAKSPYERGTGKDKRILAIAFKKITFNKIE